MVKCFVQLVIVSSIFSLPIVSPVPAAAEMGNEASSEEAASIGGHGSLEQLETPKTNDSEPRTRNSVLDLNDMEQPATTVTDWVAQMEAALVQITGVRIETTETGLQVVLETAEGELSAPATQTLGNALIVDISNAVLALPEGEEFQQSNPTAEIALVSVTGLPGNRVRVAITGVDAPPTSTVNSWETTGSNSTHFNTSRRIVRSLLRSHHSLAAQRSL